MNQNKSNVPVSVAEEPDELSYYRLTLLSFLRESHPDLADDGSFVTIRSDQAAEAFSAAIRSGRRQRTQRGLAVASRMPEGLRRLYALG